MASAMLMQTGYAMNASPVNAIAPMHGMRYGSSDSARCFSCAWICARNGTRAGQSSSASAPAPAKVRSSGSFAGSTKLDRERRLETHLALVRVLPEEDLPETFGVFLEPRHARGDVADLRDDLRSRGDGRMEASARCTPSSRE